MKQQVISLLLATYFSSPSIAALECTRNETGPGSVIDFSFGPTPKMQEYAFIADIQGVNGVLTTNDDIIKVEYHYNEYRGDIISADIWRACATSGLWQYRCGFGAPLQLPDTVDGIKIYLAPGIPATEYTLRLSFTIKPEMDLSYESVVEATHPVSVTTATWDPDATYTLDPGSMGDDGWRRSENPALIPGPVGANGTLTGTSIVDNIYLMVDIGGALSYLGNGDTLLVPEGEAIGVNTSEYGNSPWDGQTMTATLQCP